MFAARSSPFLWEAAMKRWRIRLSASQWGMLAAIGYGLLILAAMKFVLGG